VIRYLATLTLAAVAVTACRSDEPAKSTPPPVGSGTQTPVRSIDAMPAAPADAQTLRDHMREHFSAVSEMQRAIARGHLPEAKRLAAWVANHDEALLEGWQPFVDDLHAAARDVAAANDLPTAGSVAARLGRACSRCHEARTAVVSFVWEPAPDDEATLQSQMKRHQWAAARLWDGLVGPSDVLWMEGAGVLATARLDAVKAAGGDAGRGDVAALAARVRALATKAAKVKDHDERATLYGELLSTCAGCHVLVRPQPVPGP